MGYIRYVNIKQGSKSGPRFSNGSTLPFTQLPFAMAGFVPLTNSAGGAWFYHPDDHSLEGVRLSHQPSPWINDYGTIVFMPQATETPQASPGRRWSSYRPGEAVLRPDYMRLNFMRYNTVFELSPLERGCVLRISYGGSGQPYLSVLPVGGMCGYRLCPEENRLIGYTKLHSTMDKTVGFCMHFVVEFEGDVLDAGRTMVVAGDEPPVHGLSVEGEKTGIHIAFKERVVEARVAISYISADQALLNLEQERPAGDLEAARSAAEKIWEEYLSRIRVEMETEDELRTFYSCMYRVFLFPHKCYEYDKDGRCVHYCPHDGSVREGVRYTDNGFWDTYRTVYPLFSIIARKEYAEMLSGFVQDYVDCGWLPRWPSIGETGCMPSTLIDGVIADAAVKGIVPRTLLETAFEGMLHHSRNESEDKRFGRTGISAYIKYGYVPFDVAQPSVNLTLDSAYGDFCIAQTAQVLGRTDVESIYRKRALNYRNIFDPSTGFMRGRDTRGRMADGFNPMRWGGDYCEGSAWQSSFAVPHDIDGLAALYGGKDKLLAKLDEMFSTPPEYNVGSYGFVIHEMAEMAEVDFGQCAISNQPSFHIPYLYAALGQPEKTDYWVGRMCRELFSYRDDGFPGDEDNGTMAAWYIFGCLGLYPLCPGKPEYIRNGMLVKSALINGKSWDSSKFGPVISHREIEEALGICAEY